MIHKMRKNRGFMGIIITIFIAILLLVFLGFDPRAIWTNYAIPILEFIGDVSLTVLGFIVELGIDFANQLGIGN